MSKFRIFLLCVITVSIIILLIVVYDNSTGDNLDTNKTEFLQYMIVLGSHFHKDEKNLLELYNFTDQLNCHSYSLNESRERGSTHFYVRLSCPLDFREKFAEHSFDYPLDLLKYTKSAPAEPLEEEKTYPLHHRHGVLFLQIPYLESLSEIIKIINTGGCEPNTVTIYTFTPVGYDLEVRCTTSVDHDLVYQKIASQASDSFMDFRYNGQKEIVIRDF